jgi:hypothetical protein
MDWPFDKPFDTLKASSGPFLRDPSCPVGGLEQERDSINGAMLPLFASKWLAVLDKFRNFLASGEGAIMAEQIKHFNVSLD